MENNSFTPSLTKFPKRKITHKKVSNSPHLFWRPTWGYYIDSNLKTKITSIKEGKLNSYQTRLSVILN